MRAALAAVSLCVCLMLPATYMASEALRRISALETRLLAQQQQQPADCLSCTAQKLSSVDSTISSSSSNAYNLEDATHFAAPPGEPITFYGPIVVQGTITCTDVVTAKGSVVTGQTRDASYASERCGDLACVHGIQRSLTDCVCVCDTHWSGPACTVHDCFGHGTWVPAVTAMHGYCACDDAYISDMMCQYTMCNGMLADTCEAVAGMGCESPAAIGTNCSNECLQPAPCPARRNWGIPHYPTLAHMFGLCGAGFQQTDDGLQGMYADMYLVSRGLQA